MYRRNYFFYCMLFALSSCSGLYQPTSLQHTQYRIEPALKKDLVIGLSHLVDRYTENRVSDEILAKERYDIDLIFGGHTDRFFEEPRKYRNKNGGDVVVNQAGFGGNTVRPTGVLIFSFIGKKTRKGPYCGCKEKNK